MAGQLFGHWWDASSDKFTVGQLVDETPWFCVEMHARTPHEAEGGPLPVFIRLARRADGRLYCDGLILGDLLYHRFTHHREINAARLRAVKIPELIEFAVRTSDRPDAFGAMVAELLASVPTVGHSPRGPRGYGDDHFREVAQMYRRALIEAPKAPTKWLAEQYVTSMPTARRWVQRARDRGYLGASMPGRAGEVSGGKPSRRKRSKDSG